MAKGGYCGVSNIAHKLKKAYCGVGGVAHKIKKGYIGDANGKARLFWTLSSGGWWGLTGDTTSAASMFSCSDNFDDFTVATLSVLPVSDVIGQKIYTANGSYRILYNTSKDTWSPTTSSVTYGRTGQKATELVGFANNILISRTGATSSQYRTLVSLDVATLSILTTLNALQPYAITVSGDGSYVIVIGKNANSSSATNCVWYCESSSFPTFTQVAFPSSMRKTDGKFTRPVIHGNTVAIWRAAYAEQFVLLYSTDRGHTWTAINDTAPAIIDNSSINEPYYSNGKWYQWVGSNTSTSTVYYRTSTDLINWTSWVSVATAGNAVPDTIPRVSSGLNSAMFSNGQQCLMKVIYLNKVYHAWGYAVGATITAITPPASISAGLSSASYVES